MFQWIFLALLLIPLVELYVLIAVGGVIGALPTIGLTLLTAVAGAWLMRTQGLMTLQRLQAQLALGEPPQLPMVEGALILLGGMLLLIPGFITDTLGFALLIPPVRAALARRWVARRFGTGAAGWRSTVIIEGEVVERGDGQLSLPPERGRVDE